MKRNYRGFELEVYREKCLAGYPLLYYSIYQGGHELVCSFEDSDEKISTKIKYLKNWVDDFYIQVKKGICPLCEDVLSKTMNGNWYCEDCDEYYEIKS
jgi:hypothetical protein